MITILSFILCLLLVPWAMLAAIAYITWVWKWWEKTIFDGYPT